MLCSRRPILIAMAMAITEADALYSSHLPKSWEVQGETRSKTNKIGGKEAVPPPSKGIVELSDIQKGGQTVSKGANVQLR
jgi:hypothetical protein